jgi:surface polysaccharide O-acyltransferase-like enzyme
MQKIVWIDNAKIIACFFVVLAHSATNIFWEITNYDQAWWVAGTYASMTRWCISVFVMLSGQLLLDPSKIESLKVFYRKRFSRILIPLIFWSLFFLAFNYFGSRLALGSPVTVVDMVKSILMGVPYFHLWYLYMIVVFYLATPGIRHIIKPLSTKSLWVICISLFAFSILLTMLLSSKYIELPAWAKIITYLPYFLLGHLINQTKVNPPAWLLSGVFVISVVCTILGIHYTAVHGYNEYYFFENLSLTVVPMSIAIIFLLKRLTRPIISLSACKYLAALSFGVYLIHPFFIAILRYGANISVYSLHPLISIPVIAIVVFILSGASSMVIGKIPKLKRIIGM